MSAFQAAVNHSQGRALEHKDKDEEQRSKFRVVGGHST